MKIKKILLLSYLILISFSAFAQKPIPSVQFKTMGDVGATDSLGALWPGQIGGIHWYPTVSYTRSTTARTVDDTAALKSLVRKGSVQAFIRDVNTSGNFKWFASGYTVNGGTVFAAAGGGYWVRQYVGDMDVKWFGAKGDGTTDDTQLLQKVCKIGGGIRFTKGVYLINPVDPTYPTGFFGGGIIPADNSTIRFDNGVKLTMATTTANAYTFFNLSGTTNVSIYNAEVVGDVGTHAGSSGEDGYGFFVVGATNPRLYDCKASFCWGDGFYFGSGTTEGVLQNAIADNNRRQGLSIVSWTKGVVQGGMFKNTGQTATESPSYGIDVEPNGKGTDEIDVKLIGISTYNNFGGGLQIVPGSMTNVLYTRPKFNVTVIGYNSLQDGNSGALRFAYPLLTATGIRPTTPIYGKITVTDATIINSVGRGVDFARWDPGAPDVQLDNLTVIDPNTIGSTATNEQQCGVVVFLDIADIAVQTTTGKITINNPKIIDTRATPLMLVPIWMNCGSGQSIDNVTITNPVCSGQLSTSNGYTVLTRTANASITYTLPPKIDLSGNLTLQSGAYAGYSLASSVSSVTTLPLAITSVGIEYSFDNRYAVTYQIRPNAADKIQDYNLNGTNDIVLRAIGDRVKLKCVMISPTVAAWQVMSKSGKPTPLGFTPGALSKGFGIYASAAPTTGSWVVNDQVYNSTPTVGQPLGWICTVAGTPGTWVALSNLGATPLVNPMTTLGDIIYGGASGVATRLAGNTTTTQKFLTQTGTGSVSAAPAYFDLFGANNTYSGTNTFSASLNLTFGTGIFAQGSSFSTGLFFADPPSTRIIRFGYSNSVDTVAYLSSYAIKGTPTIAAGLGAGTSPTVTVTTNGRALQVTIVTGTLPSGTNATIGTVTLANALPYTPYPVFSAASSATALLNGASMISMSSTGPSNVTITSGTTGLTAATTYIWNIKL